MPESFRSAIAFISSSVTWKDIFLLPALALFWRTFPFSRSITKNLWAAKQLLSITKVRWDKFHPETLNESPERKSWGSSGTCIQLSLLPVPHLLPCIAHHLVYHLEVQRHMPSVLSALQFGSSQPLHPGLLPSLIRAPLIRTSPSLCSSGCVHLGARVKLANCVSLSNCDRFSPYLLFETNGDSNLFRM